MATIPEEKSIRVRIAPSPTGHLHIGNARAALFNLLFARHNGGTFILRTEDTDLERSKKEYEFELIEGLHWLGVMWNEGLDIENGILISKGSYGPYRDSERVEMHKNYIKKFLTEGKAYQCYCTKEELELQRNESEARGVPFRYPGTCRTLAVPPPGKTPQAVRLLMPNEPIVFDDLVRGRVTIQPSELDDFVIARADGSPLYNFTVAINDYEMKISHVIRGEEHILNTPKQIAVYRALGVPPPIFAHTPLILNLDRSKMSKRFGDTAVIDYRAKGYLPGALFNFLSLLGWHPKDDREVLTSEELAAEFDLDRVQKAGAVFDQDKLDWLNREYLKKMTDDEIVEAVKPFMKGKDSGNGESGMAGRFDHETFIKIIAVGRGRANTLRDFIEEGDVFFVMPEYEPSLLIWKKATKESVAPILKELLDQLAAVPSDAFTHDAIAAAVARVIGEGTDAPKSRGEVLWPLRVAVSGRDKSPDPVDILDIIGREESLKRVKSAIQKIEGI